MDIQVDQAFFSKDAVLRTCYNYANKYSFKINNKNGKYIINFQPYDEISLPSSFYKDFNNSLIDHELQLKIENKTKIIRDALIFAALRESWSDDES